MKSMTQRFARFGIAVALACLALAAVPATASASHYDLVDVNLVNDDARQKLAEIGVEDTRQLLARVATPEGRDDTAQATGLSSDEIHALAKQLELMQIVGIGPRASRLLMAAGVDSADALANAESTALVEQLVETNAEHQFTGVDPDEQVVSDWIAKAAGVEITLQ